MFTIGLIGGPISHAWYWTLDKFLIGTSAKIIAKKILLDQTIASPTFLFIFFMGKGNLKFKKDTLVFFIKMSILFDIGKCYKW